ncbi:ankyrin repeat-containing domain protein, partial [Colletotrichum navitas]
GADASIGSNDGWTSIDSALENGHIDVVKLLLDKGADVMAENYYSILPLSAVSRKGHTSIVKLLLSRESIKTDSQDSFGKRSLWWAGQRGHSEIVKLL